MRFKLSSQKIAILYTGHQVFTCNLNQYFLGMSNFNFDFSILFFNSSIFGNYFRVLFVMGTGNF